MLTTRIPAIPGLPKLHGSILGRTLARNWFRVLDFRIYGIRGMRKGGGNRRRGCIRLVLKLAAVCVLTLVVRQGGSRILTVFSSKYRPK